MVAPFTKGMLLGQRFEIVSPLGKGGMATVFCAQDLELDRLCAIKVLAPAMASNDILRRRFLREAENAAVMSHPNIVKVYGAHIHEGAPFIAMEYVEGVTLRERLKASFPLREGLGVLGPVALALAYAHGLSLVHRDLKPENVFCTTRSVPMVGDWGLARSQNDGTGLTKTGTLLGTPRYMSPEQIISGGGTAQSDLYSLGVMLFELCAGRTPFPGPDVPTVLRGHIEKAVPNLHNLAPGTPRDLVELINSLLQKEPEKRPQSTTKVAEQLLQMAAEVENGLLRPLRASSANLHATGQVGTLAKTAGGVSKSDSAFATGESGPSPAVTALSGVSTAVSGGEGAVGPSAGYSNLTSDRARPLQKTKMRSGPLSEQKQSPSKWKALVAIWLFSIVLTSLLTAHFVKRPQKSERQTSTHQEKPRAGGLAPIKASGLAPTTVDELLERLNAIEHKTFIKVLKKADAIRAKLQKRRTLFDDDDPAVAKPVYAHCLKEAEEDLAALYLERLQLRPIDMETLRRELPKRLAGHPLGSAAAREVLRLRLMEAQIADHRGPQPAWGYVSKILGIRLERLLFAKPLPKQIKVLSTINLLHEESGPHYRWCWFAEESMISGYVSGLSIVANPMDVIFLRLKEAPGTFDLRGRYEKLPTPKDFISKKEFILTIEEERWPPAKAAIIVHAKLFSRDHEIIVDLNGNVFRLINGGTLANSEWSGSRMRPMRLFAPIRPRILKNGKNELSIICRRVPGLSDPGAMALARVSLVKY